MLQTAMAAAMERAKAGKSEVESEPAGVGHNQVKLDECAETIRRCVDKGRAATRDTLEIYRAAGEALNSAKEMLAGEVGGFGRWCVRSGFSQSKVWRANLMLLSANYDAMVDAVKALPLEKQKWSVEGVRATWKKAMQPANPKRGTVEKKAKDDLAEIKRLRAENKQLKSKLKQKRDAFRVELFAELAEGKATLPAGVEANVVELAGLTSRSDQSLMPGAAH